MTKSTTSDIKRIVAVATIASFSSLSYVSNEPILPSFVFPIENGDVIDNKKSYEIQSMYTIDASQNKSFDTLLAFATDLLNNSKDLEPQYREIIQNNFWNLF